MPPRAKWGSAPAASRYGIWEETRNRAQFPVTSVPSDSSDIYSTAVLTMRKENGERKPPDKLLFIQQKLAARINGVNANNG